VLANINLNVLKTEAHSIGAISKNNTLFLASGFLVNDEAEIKMIFEKEHFVKLKKENREGWSAMLFEKH
jgi:ribosomal protein L11 methylase PrmA